MRDASAPLALVDTGRGNAINLKAAQIKHIHSPAAGAADILVVPGLESGNMLSDRKIPALERLQQ